MKVRRGAELLAPSLGGRQRLFDAFARAVLASAPALVKLEMESQQSVMRLLT
jgi:hypothetical protein